MQRFVVSCGVVLGLLALLVFSSRANGQTPFRDAGAWCTVTFPKDWKQAPLDKVSKFKRDASVSGVEFRAGFARTLKNGEMEFPCAILVAQPHKMTGLRYSDLEERYEGEMRVPIFPGVQTGSTEFLLGDGMMVHNLSIANMKGGDAKAVVYTFVTASGFVHLACFDAAKRFDASLPKFEEIAQSVMIDPAQQFRQSSSRSSGSTFGRRGIYGVGGGIVGVIIFALRMWARK